MIKKHNNCSYIAFENIENTGLVYHGFSTRQGGNSLGFLAEMNLGFGRGDLRETVLENYGIIGEAIGFDPKNVVFSNQAHKTKIHVATNKDRGKGIFWENDIVDVDGFITKEPLVTVTTFHADCVPLFFLDKSLAVIGLAHAGWRGTLGEIGGVAVKKMAEVYGCIPENILVGIGPSICGDCFEVHEPVVAEFTKELPWARKHIKLKDENEGKYLIDLREINKHTLIKLGVPEENIEVSNLCTMCNSELFFSHRIMGNDRGSMAAFIQIKPKNPKME